MRLCYLTRAVVFVAERRELDLRYGVPLEFKALAQTRLDVYPPKGCTLGLEMHDGMLYVYRPCDVPPTELDRERWAALTTEPFPAELRYLDR